LHAFLRRLRVIRDPRIGGIERSDFFSRKRTTASASSRFAGSVSKSAARRAPGVGQNRNHVLGARPDAAERAFNRRPHRSAVPQICLHQVGYHRARRKFPRCCISTIRPVSAARPANTRSAAISQASVVGERVWMWKP